MSKYYDPSKPLEEAFHRAIKSHLSRREQGRIMGLFRILVALREPTKTQGTKEFVPPPADGTVFNTYGHEKSLQPHVSINTEFCGRPL